MGVVHVQGVVMRTASRILGFVNVAEFRIRPEQLPLCNRGLIEAATARGDVAEEWVRQPDSAMRCPSRSTSDPTD